MASEKRFTRDQLLKKNIKPVIKPRPPKSKLKETPKLNPKLEEEKCKHKNIARDDYLKTCTNCGTVLKEDTLVPSALSEHKLIIKKTSKKNEIKSRNSWYFRDMLEDKEVPELRKLAKQYKDVGPTRKLRKKEIIEKIRYSKSEPIPIEAQKSKKELVKEAKEVGVKYINSLSKNEIVDRIEEQKIALTFNYQKMAISDLRSLAKEKGVKYISTLSKKELIEKLENKKDETDDEITKKLKKLSVGDLRSLAKEKGVKYKQSI